MITEYTWQQLWQLQRWSSWVLLAPTSFCDGVFTITLNARVLFQKAIIRKLEPRPRAQTSLYMMIARICHGGLDTNQAQGQLSEIRPVDAGAALRRRIF